MQASGGSPARVGQEEMIAIGTPERAHYLQQILRKEPVFKVQVEFVGEFHWLHIYINIPSKYVSLCNISSKHVRDAFLHRK